MKCLTALKIKFTPCNPLLPRLAAPEDLIVLAPNPATEQTVLMYELVQQGSVSLFLSDAGGRELYRMENQNHNGSFTLNLSTYPSGNYPVRLVQNGKIIYSSTLIKK